ncbi:MAG: DUF559 domain-containing protein [Armatimonadetes bacterium]|nr:DUF559 domain-containing protein [Armatimonadota bacterium]
MARKADPSRRVQKICLICGKEFEVLRIHEDRYITCGSRECRSTYKIRKHGGEGTAVEKLCPICNQTFIVKPSLAPYLVTCGKNECKRTYHREKLRKKWGLPSWWQGDKAPLIEKKCVICGKPFRVIVTYYKVARSCGSQECISAIRSRCSGFRNKGRRPSEKMLAEALASYPNWIPEYRVHTRQRNPDGTFAKGVANNYRLDFGNPVDKVYVEIDGSSHTLEGAKERDERKDEFMKSLGWQGVRIPESEVLESLEVVVNRIIALSPTPYQAVLFEDL